MPRQRNNGDPHELVARFESHCPETGLTIRKGDTCVYYPKARKAYHSESRAADDFRSMKFAENCGMADANW